MGLAEQWVAKSFSQRLKWIQAILLLIMGVIIARALYLQVVIRKDLEIRAASQYQQSRSIKLQRGTITDRNGNLLAVSLPMYSLFAQPRQIKDPNKVAEALSGPLKVSKDDLLPKLTSTKSFLWLERYMPPLDMEKIKALNLEGVDFLKEYYRFYPLEHHASQVLGFSGVDSKGLEGLEFQYNQHLMDGTGPQAAWASFYKDPTLERLSGGSIQLTLDSRLQYYVEEELAKGVQGLKANWGVAIAMERETGKILAMATKPDFDPNHFSKSKQETYFNRAVGIAYEPGSTFKMITLATALEHGVVSKDDFFFCENGEYQIADRTIHDVANYGWLSLEKIIQKSSNICAAKIGLIIPKETFHKSISAFGFGEKTNLGLPAEAAGKLLPFEEWNDVAVATLSYGHGVSVTPIQMLAAINTIANKGVLVEPVLIESLQAADGEPIEQSHKSARRILKPEVAAELIEYMKAVTENEGTGRFARLGAVKIAGKTGTSRKLVNKTGEYSTDKHIRSFVGFFPADDPWITLLVVIDEPDQAYMGTTSAVTTFREIVRRVLPLNPKRPATPRLPPSANVQLFQTSPITTSASSDLKAEQTATEADSEQETPSSGPTATLAKDASLEEIKKRFLGKSLREALAIASIEGVQLVPEGKGIVTDLIPSEGRTYYVRLKP